MNPVVIGIQSLTELLVAGNVAIPVIFAAVKTIRDAFKSSDDPELTDDQLITIMEQAFQRNAQRNIDIRAEIEASRTPSDPVE